MRLIVGIPNYNAGENLVHLLPQLIDQDFDAIYVLDDASTDNSLELLYEFSKKVEVIAGQKNLGPGGNRNRLLPKVKPDDIIMFLDADMMLRTRNVRANVVDVFKKYPKVALVGGGIYNKKGQPMGFNYGLNRSRTEDFVGILLSYLATLLHFKPLIWPIRALARRFTLNVEIAHFPARRRRVDWVAEGHFYVRGDVFKKLGGFDRQLQYGEGNDLASRIRKAGYQIIFDPGVWAQHLEYHVRHVNKLKEQEKVRAKEHDRR